MTAGMDRAGVLAVLDNVACGAPVGHAFRTARTAIAEVYAQRDALVEAAEAELVEVERRERLGAIRPEERGTVDCLRAALARCAGEKS